MAMSYFDIAADMVQAGKDPEGAIRVGRQALAMYEKLCADYPDNYDYRRNQGVTLHWIGCAQLALGDFNSALETFRKQLAVLGSGDPTSARAREKIASGHLFVAIALDRLNRPAEGLQDARKAVAIREELASADKPNSWKRWYLIQATAQTARLTARAGDREAAQQFCQKAQALLEDKKDDATNVSQTIERARAYHNLAEAYTILGSDKKISLDEYHRQWTTARTFYQECLDLWTQLQSNPNLPARVGDRQDKLAREIARCDAALAAR
jgi:tetratricopeptide (TPR) repeat protein